MYVKYKSSINKMSKSIKFKDGNYIDSSGVVHEHSTLNEMIASHNNGICRKLRISEVDANELTEYGNALIEAEKVKLNFPENGDSHHYHIIQLFYNADYVVQIAIHVWRTPLKMHIRRKISGTWSSWTSLIPS